MFARLIGLIAAVLFAPAASMAPAPFQGPGRLPADAVPERYELTIRPDADKLAFQGHVRIELRVLAPTDRLVLNGVELQVDRAALTAGALKIAPQVTAQAQAQTLTFAFPRPLKPGRYALDIDYRGKILERPAGFFAVDYDAGKGRERSLLTQLEPADARRLLPCWDEPARKAVLQLAIEAPEGQMAVSNMPEASREVLPGGLARTRFQPTPPMSTYLIFVGVGNFERLSTTVDGVRVGVVVHRGDTEKARFALQTAAQVLKYYDSYFGVRFPLPKLDLIAPPGDVGPAMENWGAILFGQSELLADPHLTTAGERQASWHVIAHEMAHQWFGDLVTMGWWDDLWLNEGFASWMSTKALNRFHPEWRGWLRAASETESAMVQDAFATTHPVVQPVATTAQAEQAFDDITYRKGQAVIRMLEAYVGETAFRDGVRRYMKAHAYGATADLDLWREIEAASGGKPVVAVEQDFVRQPGVPLIQVTARDIRAGVAGQARQGRFAADDASRAPQTWRVPLRAEGFPGGKLQQALVAQGMPVFLSAGGAPALIVNAGHIAYARTAYDDALFDQVRARFAALPAEDQLGLLYDTFALGTAGYRPWTDSLDLMERLPPEAEPEVWTQTIALMNTLADLYDNGPHKAQLDAWARARLAPVLARTGWDARAGETASVGVLRTAVLNALARFGDAAVLAEARARFDRALSDPAAFDPDARRSVIRIAARYADAAAYDRLLAAARASRDPLEREQLFRALARPKDAALARRTLELAMSDEAPSNFAGRLFEGVAEENPDLAWRFALDHWKALRGRLDAVGQNELIPDIAAGSFDVKRAEELRAFAAKEIPAEDRASANRAISLITFNAKARRERVPEIDNWIAAHG